MKNILYCDRNSALCRKSYQEIPLLSLNPWNVLHSFVLETFLTLINGHLTKYLKYLKSHIDNELARVNPPTSVNPMEKKNNKKTNFLLSFFWLSKQQTQSKTFFFTLIQCRENIKKGLEKISTVYCMGKLFSHLFFHLQTLHSIGPLYTGLQLICPLLS